MKRSELPGIDYEYEINRLVKYYKQALINIQFELDTFLLSDMRRKQLKVTLVNVATILQTLDETTKAWLEENLQIAVEDGVINTILALEIADTLEEARKLATFSGLNEDYIKTVIADTYNDLAQITANTEKRVKVALRQVIGETARMNMAEGVNGVRTISKESYQKLQEKLQGSVNKVFVDASGRKWDTKTYVDTVVRTKMSEAHRESTINTSVERGKLYAQISRHGAKDACSKWEGRIVKLIREAEGDYPYVGDLPTREIFHPRCKHFLIPVNLD